MQGLITGVNESKIEGKMEESLY